MATNLSAHAKPWAPGAGPNTHNNNHSSNNNNDNAPNMHPPMMFHGHHGGGGMGLMAAPQQHTQQQQQPPQQQPKFSPTAAKLFVGQLPFECTEERLRHLFTAYGLVEHIHILRDNNNRSRGAAFVTYSTVQEADTAIFTLHNRYRMLTNRAIQVSYAKNSPNISPFGTYSAFEVHQSNPTNPMPDVAASGTQTRVF